MSEPENPQMPESREEPRPTQPLPAAVTAPFNSPAAPETGLSRPLLLVAGGLSLFILMACVSLAALLVFLPNVRERLPLVGGSGNASAGPPPEGPAKYTEQAAAQVRLREDFNLPTDRWEQSQTMVVDGAYEINLDQANYDTYGLFLGAANVENFDLSVDVTQVSGTPIAEYGVRFRQTGPGEHLMFGISGNGYFRLLRVSDETYSSVIDWATSPALKPGLNVTNRLRLVVNGPEIVAYINESEVLRYRDPAPAAGQLTLGLTTFDRGGVKVRFDNLTGSAEDTDTLAGTDQAVALPLDEDFSDPSSVLWSVGGAQLKAAKYEVFAGGAVQSWQQPLPTGSSRVSGNFVLEVDAEMLSGNGGGSAYGVMFGDGGDFDFFALMLYPEGAISLSRTSANGISTFVIEPTPIEVVNAGPNAVNTIRIEANANILKVTINGQELGDLEFEPDTDFGGMVGLIISSSDADGVRARFDNFRLEEQ